MYGIDSDELDALAERSLTEDFCADCGEQTDSLETVEDDDGREKRVCPTCATMYGSDD